MAHRKDVVASIRRLESTCRALETPGISSRALSKGHHFGRISRNNRPYVLSLPFLLRGGRDSLLLLSSSSSIHSKWFGHWFSNVCPLDYQPFADLVRFLEKKERGVDCFSNWRKKYEKFSKSEFRLFAFLLWLNFIKSLIAWKISSNRKKLEGDSDKLVALSASSRGQEDPSRETDLVN